MRLMASGPFGTSLAISPLNGAALAQATERVRFRQRRRRARGVPSRHVPDTSRARLAIRANRPLLNPNTQRFKLPQYGLMAQAHLVPGLLCSEPRQTLGDRDTKQYMLVTDRYPIPGRGARHPISGVFETGCFKRSDTGMCLSAPGDGVPGDAAGLRNRRYVTPGVE